MPTNTILKTITWCWTKTRGFRQKFVNNGGKDGCAANPACKGTWKKYHWASAPSTPSPDAKTRVGYKDCKVMSNGKDSVAIHYALPLFIFALLYTRSTHTPISLISLEEDIIAAKAKHLSRNSMLVYHHGQYIQLAKLAKEYQREVGNNSCWVIQAAMTMDSQIIALFPSTVSRS